MTQSNTQLKQDVQYIDTQSALIELCTQLSDAPYLAIDTEFVREKTYSARLCLIQIASENIIACIDPLKLEQMDCLLDLLYNPGIIKIFHAARQDLEIFYDMKGELPTPVFDTQIAATLIGQSDQCGYATLVNAFFNIELDKGQTRTDWSQRPLDDAQLNYAADDVRYLIKLYPLIKKQLKDSDRDDWLDTDFSALTNPDLYKVDEQTIWKKVSGSNRLKGVQLAILQQLAAWREQQAISKNKPRKWILSNDVLITLTRIAPSNIAELEKIRGLSENYLKNHAQELLDTIKKAKSIPKEQWPIIKIKKPTSTQDTLTDLLMAALRLQAQKHRISTAMIATRKDIEKLVMGERDLPIITGWRKHLVGDTLLDIIDGKLMLKVENNQVVLESQ